MLLAISVDLDEVHHYRAIHGETSGELCNAVYKRALPRLSDWARQRRLPLTWFVVGQDLEIPENAEAVRSLANVGDEMGSHSYSHRYELSRLSFSEMREEVERGVAILQRTSGAAVSGFRAPGYVVNDTLLDLLREAGFAYDSSVFPCPSYYALKLARLGAMQARGQRSSAVVDAPDVLRAPTIPYRVGRPYWFRGTGIWEIPIQVTRRVRLPFIGTALTLAGTRGARLLTRGVLGEKFVNLELHGIDVLDRSDGLADLALKQPDLRTPWHKKLDAIDAAVGMLLQHGYRATRLDELASQARLG